MVMWTWGMEEEAIVGLLNDQRNIIEKVVWGRVRKLLIIFRMKT